MTPLHALRVPIAKVTDVDPFGDGIEEDGPLLACLYTETAAVAPFSAHSHDPDLLVPGEGVPLAGREAALALGADEWSIDPLPFPDQNLDSGPPRIKLPFMRESTYLFADAAAGAFLMIHTNPGSMLTGCHVEPPF